MAMAQNLYDSMLMADYLHMDPYDLTVPSVLVQMASPVPMLMAYLYSKMMACVL